MISANRGLRLHGTHDAVLLNSDTRVFADWLPRLKAAAYSGPRVGTVTPLTNNGSIASYPHPAGAAMDPEAARDLHSLAAATLAETRVEIPVGVGFCLYIRRDCLRDVGELDATVFAMGYGEESDFCLRARNSGWTHRLAADVFVYHAEGVSFGGRRRALLERSQRLINLRHPGYDRFIASFHKQNPLRVARRRLDERQLRAVEGRFVLLVTLALEGGVARFVTERCRQLMAQGFIPMVLRPAVAGNARRCELWTPARELPNLKFDIPGELADLQALLGALALEAIEIQHFLHLDARVIEAVRALTVTYDVVVHDYSWICPRVTLIDGSDQYCGEPAIAKCTVCVRRHGSKLGENISVRALRERSGTWLAGARQVIAPSADAATRLQRYYPGLAVDVRPHAAVVDAIALPPRPPRRQSLRVALIGAIGTHKGYRVLLACARDARARKLPIEFVVIGHTEDDAPLLATNKVFITGYYGEAEASHLLQREHPDIAWLPSVWPETWSYTLDYALAARLPVMAFDLGAIAERVRDADLGELLPLGLAPRHINDRLMALGERTSSERRRGDPTASEWTGANRARPDHRDMHGADDHVYADSEASAEASTEASTDADAHAHADAHTHTHAAAAAAADTDRDGHGHGHGHDEAHGDLTESKTFLTESSASLTESQGFVTEAEYLQTRMPRVRDEATMQENSAGETSMAKSSNGKNSPDANPEVRTVREEGLSASVQVLPLPPGLYLFSVKSASPPPVSGYQISLPALHVGLGPGVRSDQVEFIAGPSTHGAWLFSAGDLLVTKINGTGATLILNSVRAPGGEVLSIGVEKLEGRADILASPAVLASASKVPALASSEGAKPLFKSEGDDLPLSVAIGAHLRKRGDMTFANVPWAGRVATGLWIESFSVKPLEHFAPGDIEYKGLTGSGFETPWMSDAKMCGTKGMATPLVGFAIRLRPSPAAAAYDCEYSGYFQSGTTVGPLRNGAPCRSNVANDSLEGIQVRIVKRTATSLPEAGREVARKTSGATPAKPVARLKPETTPRRAADRPDGKKPTAIAHGAPIDVARATRRQSNRRP